MVESTEEVTDTFSILAHPVRRYVLYYLAELEAPVTFDRLATRVAAWQTDSDPETVNSDTLDQIRTVLYHVHLPKLAEVGVITYDDNPGDITPTDAIDSLAPFIEPARRAELGASPVSG